MKPVLLCILNGYGINPESYGNAVKAAHTPVLDRFFHRYPYTQLGASGPDVGMPLGTSGSSEGGHMNLGAGRVVRQELSCISDAIEDGSFFSNPALTAAMDTARDGHRALHLIGMLSDGGIHSHISHLFALLEMAKMRGLSLVYVHVITDGRDTHPEAAWGLIDDLREKMKSLGLGQIATISGRHFAMDREGHWDRIEKTYAALVYGESSNELGVRLKKGVVDPGRVMERCYTAGISDEFIPPTVTCETGVISRGDSIIFFNFRSDRMRQLAAALLERDFRRFDRFLGWFPLQATGMVRYNDELSVAAAFTPEVPENMLGPWLAAHGKTQLRIAETATFPYVTQYFNGHAAEPLPGEEWVRIEGIPPDQYLEHPEMNAAGLADECVRRVRMGRYDVIVVNFANCDAVGHTGSFEAAKGAVEAVDANLERVILAVRAMGGAALITADHGNAERMYNMAGSPNSGHTRHQVPLCLVGFGGVQLRQGGVLGDVAPTLLRILGLPPPPQMLGRSLVIEPEFQLLTPL